VKIVPRPAPALRMVIATQRGCASVTLGTAESSAILATVRLAKNAQQDAAGVPHATRTADAVAMGLARVILDLWGPIVRCVRWVYWENTATSYARAQSMAIALSTGHVSVTTNGLVNSAVSADKASLVTSASGFVTAMSIAAIADDVRHMASAVATTNSRVLAAATARQAFLESLVRKYVVARRRAEDMEGVIMMGHANVTRGSPGQHAIFAGPKAEI